MIFLVVIASTYISMSNAECPIFIVGEMPMFILF